MCGLLGRDWNTAYCEELRGFLICWRMEIEFQLRCRFGWRWRISPLLQGVQSCIHKYWVAAQYLGFLDLPICANGYLHFHGTGQPEGFSDFRVAWPRLIDHFADILSGPTKGNQTQ